MNKPLAPRYRTWSVRIGTAIAAGACSLTALLGLRGDEPQEAAAIASRAGRVSWSDGTTAEGTITTTPGTILQLVTVAAEGEETGQLRTFTLDRVAEIAFVPFASGSVAPERMVRAFGYTAEGPDKAGPRGEPYPVRELGASVRFIDGEELFGVLRSCVFYLKTVPSADERPAGRLPPRPTTRKLTIKSRLEGKPGSTLDDLSYVTHIRLPAVADAGPSRLPLKLPAEVVRDGDTVTALVQTSLESVPVTSEGSGLSVRGTLGENILVAIHRADGSVDVGWPEPMPADADLRAVIEKAVSLQPDYYDERRLLGVVRDGPSRVLALVSLRRTGRDTNDTLLSMRENSDTRPTARASVWMFRIDETGQRVALVRRGTFVRQKIELDDPTPTVRPLPALWPSVRDKDRITVGQATEESR
ncbi:MAG: hypothetical protein NTW36_04720 [Planctomycetia bacterium]|nr:hypothetical protein [Planctomycetia bacterium]